MEKGIAFYYNIISNKCATKSKSPFSNYATFDDQESGKTLWNLQNSTFSRKNKFTYHVLQSVNILNTQH